MITYYCPLGHSGRVTPGLVSNPEVKPPTLEGPWDPRGPAALLSRDGLSYNF